MMRGIYIERAMLLGLLVLAVFLTSKLQAAPVVFVDVTPTGNFLNLD